ncbi:MAG: tetratricopeptide repeat protein [Geminicoccaceae bacterium]|nr:tetratricopeptide repeat protein [Geminicoccaceae bacterium]MDW8124963.1 tetratricopeptide repeat protein [Geminicoccaceae bacterium]
MPSAEIERTAAVLHADLENYTGRMARDPRGTMLALRRCRNLFRSRVAAAGGRVVDLAADSVLAEFPDAKAGVLCALAIQSRLAEPMAHTCEVEPLRYRVGMDFGQLIVARDGLYGLAVNRAARIQEIAEPGEVLVSDAVQAAVGPTNEIVFAAQGILRLKNLPDPVAVFRARRPDEPSDVAGRRRPLGNLALPPLPSLVVLPIRPLGSDPRGSVLAEGLTEDLITDLSRFRDLFVIGRASAFAYRDLDLPASRIGRELGVRWVLDAGLRVDDDRLILHAHLVDAASGKVAWSERLERDGADLFALERDLARNLAAMLAGRVEDQEQRRLHRAGPPQLEAYGQLLLGLGHLYRYTAAGNAAARAAFERALELDPGYARALAMLSRTHNYDWRYRWSREPEISLALSLELAREAVALDPADARGYAELGFARLYSKDVAGALEAYETAHRLNPNDPDVLAFMADALVYAGRAREALELVAKAKRLNPHYPDVYLWSEADALFSLGLYDEVVAAIGKMRDPAEGCRLLAASHALAGRPAEARRYAELVLRRQPNFTVSDWIATQPDTDPEERERFRRGLLLAGLPP